MWIQRFSEAKWRGSLQGLHENAFSIGVRCVEPLTQWFDDFFYLGSGCMARILDHLRHRLIHVLSVGYLDSYFPPDVAF